MKITFDKFKRLLKESSSSIYDEYEDILCEVFEVDDISEITKQQYKQLISEYENNTLNEHDSSLLEDATDLVWQAASENGYNILAHHGTTKEFSEFKYGDIGFHLGTLEQAKMAARSHEYDDPRIYPKSIMLNTAISLHNPLVINNDPEIWNPGDLFYYARNTINRYIKRVPYAGDSEEQVLEKAKVLIDNDIQNKKLDINNEELYRDVAFLILYQFLKFSLKEILNAVGNNQKQLIVDRIKSLGYDGIKYLNLYEIDEESDVREYSYIVLDANQIKNCEVVSFSNGKVVPLENRFNSNTNNLFESKKDKAYLMALEIFNTLTDEEKWLVSPRHGMLKNVPVLYRYVIQHKAFIDIYPYNNNPKIGFILLAVNPEYRRMGMTQKLIQRTVENCKRLGIKKLIWRCDSNNIGSYKAAIANGFKLKTKGKTYYSFEKVIE